MGVCCGYFREDGTKPVITRTIPNRLAYFDAQNFVLQPMVTRTSVRDAALESSEFLLNVFPEPSSDEFIIRYTLTDAAEVSFVVYSALGTPISTTDRSLKSAGNHEERIAVRNFPSGLYSVRMIIRDRAVHRLFRVLR